MSDDVDDGADREDGADSDGDGADADRETAATADDVADEAVDDVADDPAGREAGERADGSLSTAGGDASTGDQGRAGDATADPDLFADVDSVAGPGDPFEEIDPEPVDEDAVWADLVGSDGDGVDGATVADAVGTGPAVDIEGDEAVVPKRSYCERCEHFAAPPETACTNPGTRIRELVDVEHFRVSNCPVVERRRQVGESTED